MAKASINFAKSVSGALRHNDRTQDKEPDYLLPVEHRLKNEVDVSAVDAERKIKELYSQAKINYKNKFNQPLKAKSYLWEAVVNLNQEHTLEDVKRLVSEIEKETGFTSVQIAIHRDEGHINERGVAQRNLHAHITFFTLDKNTGQQLYRRALTKRQKEQQPNLKPMNKERLSKLQDLTAEVLNMQRGKKGSKAVRLEHKQYRALKRAELAKLKDLKAEISILRAELKEQKAKREDYAQLEAENKALREQIKAKELTITQLNEKIENLRQKLIKNSSKDAKIEQYKNLLLEQEERIDKLIDEKRALQAKISDFLSSEGKSIIKELKNDLRAVFDELNSKKSAERLLKEFFEQEAEPITKIFSKEPTGYKITNEQLNYLYELVKNREEAIKSKFKTYENSIESLTYQEKLLYERYKSKIEGVGKGYFVDIKDNRAKIINQKKGVFVEDIGNKIIAKSDNLKEQIRLMLDVAEAKGWDLEKIKVSGSEEFKRAMQREIKERVLAQSKILSDDEILSDFNFFDVNGKELKFEKEQEEKKEIKTNKHPIFDDLTDEENKRLDELVEKKRLERQKRKEKNINQERKTKKSGRGLGM